MNIALIAHDKKKELLVDFCIAYKDILQQHKLFATASVAAPVAEATGLNIHKFTPGPHGEEKQIEGMVSYNEIDFVIFFRDPLSMNDYEHDTSSLFRLCDINSIPFATNIATAEMLIKGVERGDLAWRELVNPTLSPKNRD